MILAIAAVPPRAQQPAYATRTVIANVYNPMGEPVAGLDASAFEARLGHKPVKILSAKFDFSPRRVVLLLDVGESMNDPVSWKVSVDVAREMVVRQPLQNPVALLVFAEGVKERHNFAQNRQTILDALDSLRGDKKPAYLHHGGSDYWGAIRDALETLGPFQMGDVFFLISYGLSVEYGTNPTEVKQALLAAGVRLLVFVPPIPGRMAAVHAGKPERIGARESLRELVVDTGGILGVGGIGIGSGAMGNAMAPLPENWKREMLDYMQSTINVLYKLELELPEDIRKPQKWELKLVPTPAAKKSKWQVIYQSMLLPCAANEPQK
jgi:von Willebrand factor type A domain